MAPKLSLLFSFILIILCIHSHAVSSHSDDLRASPFEFIKHLQGSQKGDKVKGLNELKQYLQRFGYLSDSYKVHTQNVDNDNFDDVLEAAIKTYQVNYNLNATGTLNAETISKMVLPRCGVPDIINGKTWMRSGKEKATQDHHGHNNKVHMVSHYKLFDQRQKWPSSKPQLNYWYSGTTPNEAKAAINQAFNGWTSATTSRFKFTLVQNSNTAQINIGFYRNRHGGGHSFFDDPFDGPYGVAAHAGAPTSGLLHFDADGPFSYTSPPGPSDIDLESVALHEIGHLLGLDHSSIEEALMYPSIYAGKTKGINADDLNGINDLYGTP